MSAPCSATATCVACGCACMYVRIRFVRFMRACAGQRSECSEYAGGTIRLRSTGAVWPAFSGGASDETPSAPWKHASMLWACEVRMDTIDRCHSGMMPLGIFKSTPSVPLLVLFRLARRALRLSRCRRGAEIASTDRWGDKSHTHVYIYLSGSLCAVFLRSSKLDTPHTYVRIHVSM